MTGSVVGAFVESGPALWTAQPVYAFIFFSSYVYTPREEKKADERNLCLRRFRGWHSGSRNRLRRNFSVEQSFRINKMIRERLINQMKVRAYRRDIFDKICDPLGIIINELCSLLLSIINRRKKDNNNERTACGIFILFQYHLFIPLIK